MGFIDSIAQSEDLEMAEEPKAEKLKEERQLLAPRLTAFLIGNSVFVLGFGTMIGNACFYPKSSAS
jgi:hypothetical protein